jgi:hypothetical protein
MKKIQFVCGHYDLVPSDHGVQLGNPHRCEVCLVSRKVVEIVQATGPERGGQ